VRSGRNIQSHRGRCAIAKVVDGQVCFEVGGLEIPSQNSTS
jgi:hypothetical protein